MYMNENNKDKWQYDMFIKKRQHIHQGYNGKTKLKKNIGKGGQYNNPPSDYEKTQLTLEEIRDSDNRGELMQSIAETIAAMADD